jgi:hypothetical protein
MKYKPKSLVSDIGTFSMGSVALGAGAVAVAPFGGSYGSGLATMGTMMPTLASLTMMKHQVGMLGEANRQMKKVKW